MAGFILKHRRATHRKRMPLFPQELTRIFTFLLFARKRGAHVSDLPGKRRETEDRVGNERRFKRRVLRMYRLRSSAVGWRANSCYATQPGSQNSRLGVISPLCAPEKTRMALEGEERESVVAERFQGRRGRVIRKGSPPLPSFLQRRRLVLVGRGEKCASLPAADLTFFLSITKVIL